MTEIRVLECGLHQRIHTFKKKKVACVCEVIGLNDLTKNKPLDFLLSVLKQKPGGGL